MSDSIATVEDLVAAREARGLGPDDVMRHLKLAPRQLAALEGGDWAALPGQAFVRGMLRAYGRMVETDVEPLVTTMSASVHAADLRPAASLDEPLPTRSMLGFGSGGSGSRIAWLMLLAVGALALVLFFGGANLGGIGSWLQSTGSAPTVATSPGTTSAPGTTTEALPLSTLQQAAPAGEAPPLPATPEPLAAASPTPGVEGATAPAPVEPGAALPSPAPASAAGGVVAAGSEAPSGGRVLRLKFDAEAWVEARRDGKVIFAGTQASGSSRELPIDGRTALVIGNAAKVHAEFDGKPLALTPHLRGTVARLTLP